MPLPDGSTVLGQKRRGKYLYLYYKTKSGEIHQERRNCVCPPRKRCVCGGEMPVPIDDIDEDEDEDVDYEMRKPEVGHEKPHRLPVFTEELPEFAPPAVRNILKKWGDGVVFKARICRVPIKQKFIIKLGNIVTFGDIERRRKELERLYGSNYSEFFHLYVELAVRNPDGEVGVFKFEKDEKAKVTVASGGVTGESKCINQPPTKKVKLLDMFKRAEKAVGPKNMWVYDLGSTNCQDFAIALLGSGNGFLSQAGRDFAKQDVKQLVPSWILSVAKSGTDLANRLKSFLFGKGLEGGSSEYPCTCGGSDTTVKRSLSSQIDYDYYPDAIRYVDGVLKWAEEMKRSAEGPLNDWEAYVKSQKPKAVTGIHGFFKKIFGWASKIPVIGVIGTIGEKLFELQEKALDWDVRRKLDKGYFEALKLLYNNVINEYTDRKRQLESMGKTAFNDAITKDLKKSVLHRVEVNPEWGEKFKKERKEEMARELALKERVAKGEYDTRVRRERQIAEERRKMGELFDPEHESREKARIAQERFKAEEQRRVGAEATARRLERGQVPEGAGYPCRCR